eukprot:CAMPEP_0198213354 /NCGR_PEP_ID=MMETSP1445-20131203/28816_1 /TAXON_ID=36898 /ORGANISM="Pyramimonas sp., Strain CCMP2087" /LENGTH=1184 /DNA_ID=CAMNT_0043887981 /DNA_START=34 /DNA_END=3588 /DNA_ORIENTATION=-
MAEKLKLWGSHSRTNKVKVVADLAGVTIETTPDFEFGKTNKTPEYLALNPFGKVPVLETSQGGLFESNAICRYLVNVGKPDLCGKDVFQKAKVDAWLDSYQSIDPLIASTVYAMMGYFPYERKEAIKAMESLHERLRIMEISLSGRSFLVGDSLTLADVCGAFTLLAFYTNVLNAEAMKPYPSVQKWLEMVYALPQVVKHEGAVTQCTAVLKYDAAALKLKAVNGWPSYRVRNTFIDFFVKKYGHTHFVSSAVVPHDDPTLLFTNAGMNQYKAIFLGQADPNGPLAKLTKATNTQKCIRAGGKHNDLDDVGKDTYHHTFFEMLGNWSFGDYFKREAINMAWELLTDVYKLDPARIYATYFGGDASLGLEPDLEAKAIWLELLPDWRVLPFDCTDNFWEMGDQGPCGPATEIHYDRIGGGRNVAHLVNYDDPNVIEIWNNVFIQYNREADGSLKLLPKQHVDTGMGFERITSILQNVLSNYDTDIFIPIFESIQEVTGAPSYTGLLGAEDATGRDMAYRVVADHIRTLSFAIADGARPGSDGRNYVLRRILRRAVRYGKEKLGAEDGFFNKLVTVVAREFGDVFPEVRAKAAEIQEIIEEEETSFTKTLQKGLERFHRSTTASKTKIVDGDEAFQLWDTYGFPVDLTQLMAEEKGMEVDMVGFEAAMEKQKEMSRAARKTGGAAFIKMEAEATSHLANAGVKPTLDSAKYVWNAPVPTKVAAIMTLEGFRDSTEGLSEGDLVGLVLDATSFYAEQGGQVFDTGVVSNSGGKALLQIEGVSVSAGFVLHTGLYSAGADIKMGDDVVCNVDYARRSLVAPNHTCTHVLNHALLEVLGENVNQKGSLVDPEKLRFDFSHGKPVTPEQLAEIEAKVQAVVAANVQVSSKDTPLEEAKKIFGLRAVFGEVYPDPVRVVSVGADVDALLADPDNAKWGAVSTEFCGGTHLSKTGDAEAFVLLSEEGTAKGIRRITGLTKGAAAAANARAAELGVAVAALDKLSGEELEKTVTAIKVELDNAVIGAVQKAALKAGLGEVQKVLLEAAKKAAAGNKAVIVEAAKGAAEAAAAKGDKFCVVSTDMLDAAAVRDAVTQVLKMGTVAIALFAVDAATNKVMLYTGVPPKVEMDGVEWMKAGVAAINGKGGGGKGGMAQGQGVGADQLEALKAAATAFAASALGVSDCTGALNALGV